MTGETAADAPAPLPAAAERTDGATVPALVIAVTDRAPNAVALRRKRLGIWHETTYGELVDRVGAIAAALLEHGAGPGERVAVVADTGPEWVVADLAIQAAGAACVAVHPTEPAPAVGRMLAHAGVRLAFCGDQEQVDKLVDVRERLPALERIVVFDPRGLAVQDVPGLERWEAFGRAGDGGGADLRRLVAALDPEDVAVVAQTSGTTGEARGVLLQHRNLVSMAQAAGDWLGLGRRDRTLSHVSPADPAARVVDLYAPLLAGAALGFPESPDTVPVDLAEIAPTVLLTAPRGLELMKASHDLRAARAGRVKRRALRWGMGRLDRGLGEDGRTRGRRSPAHLLVGRWVLAELGLLDARHVVVAGGRVAPELQRFFAALGVSVHETYGQAETTGLVTAQRTFADAGTAGAPLPGTEVRIADGGEILVRGPCVGAGYLGDADAFDGDWYRTGDVGRLDDEGRLVIRERRRALVGDLAPSEIEAALERSAYVARAVALVGDRPFVGALLQVEFATVAAWAEARDLGFTTYRSLARAPEVRELVEAEVDRANADLPEAARVKAFRLLPRELNAAEGEVTPTRKLKREAVARRFSADIDDLYGASR